MEGVNQFPSQQLLFQAIFERSNEAIAIIDECDCLIEVNPTACALFDATRNELVGNSISNWFDFPLDDEIAEVQWQQTDGSSKTIEYSRVSDLLPNYHFLNGFFIVN